MCRVHGPSGHEAGRREVTHEPGRPDHQLRHLAHRARSPFRSIGTKSGRSMRLEQIFFADARLRPIWRFFISIALLFVTYMATGMAVGMVFRALHMRPHPMTVFFWMTLALLPAILAAFKLLTAIFERRPLGSVGLAFHQTWGRELAHGLAVGGVMLGSAVALEWAAGFLQFVYPSQPLMKAAVLTCGLFAVAATNEEATFRGYPFQRLV